MAIAEAADNNQFPFAEAEMKAVVFEKHGDLDGLEWRDWPEPEPAADEVKVRIQAAGFNGFDPMVLKGIPTLKTPLPMIPGGDMAGDIVGIGSDVPAGRWSIDDRVMINPLHLGRGLMGETQRGGFCEYVCVPHQYLIRIPDAVSYIDAAALPIAYGTAHRMMVTRGKVAAGERVLVLGATGGVGTCCIQLAKLAGAEVAACTSSSAKAARLKEIGADHVINTSEQDFVTEIVKLWGKPKVWGDGGGADVVVNFIGGQNWAKSLRTVRRDGRLLTCGATDGYDPQTDIRYIWSFELNIVGSNGWTNEDLRALLDLVAAGRLKPIINSVRKMHEAQTSMREFMDRKVLGKSILVP
jgi:alcohol dehydrogenase